jgi:sodium transport system permease protein
MTKEMTENITIAQTTVSYSEAAQDFLLNYVAAQDPNIILTEPVDDAWQAINDKKVKLVVEIDQDFEAKLRESKPFTLKILFDNSQSRSGGATGTLESAIQKVNGAIAQKRLEALNVDPQILTRG